MADNSPTPFALVGVFDSPAAIYEACEKVRDAGYRRFDAHTPFPVHGLEKAMGLPPSKLPWVVLACGLTGLTIAFTLQYWVHAIAYPQVISGKPYFAYQAMVPICFELTVLLSAFGAFFGMWAMNRLPTFYHPVMKHPKFPSFSDDKFLLSLECADPKYDLAGARSLLESAGGHDIEEVLS